MKKTSKAFLKGTLLAGIAAAAVTSAQAQYTSGDAFAAFTSYSGNDLIFNLGLNSSLYNGETWNLNGLLTGNLAETSSLTWAVLGTDSSNVYASESAANSPAPVAYDFYGTKGAINSIGNFITSGTHATPAETTTYSFGWETSTSSGPTALVNDYGVVGGNFSGASQVQDYYQADNGDDAAAQLTPGYFTLYSSGVLIYGVPEPSTYALVTLGGLMLLVARRQFTRKA